MQRSVRSIAVTRDVKIRLIEAEFFRRNLYEERVHVRLVHHVADVTRDMLNERKLVGVVLARDDLKNEHFLFQFLFRWNENSALVPT